MLSDLDTDNIRRLEFEYDILQYFTYQHLPSHLQRISEPFNQLAYGIAGQAPHCDEARAGLRKLLEAKDCFVRAMLHKT